jgi:hypothetical protein
MCDEHGRILRNSFIWNKARGGPDNSTDKFRNVREDLFHFVKTKKYYCDGFYGPEEAAHGKNTKRSFVSATEVTEIRYKCQIELSAVITDDQKPSAFLAH